MKTPPCLILLAAALVAGCSRQSQSPPPPPATNAPTAPESAFGSLGRAQKSAVKTVDTTALTKAIELFQVDKGRLPKDLNELVAGKYMPVLPAAPAGMKIAYDPATGEVKVVSQ